mmetsp:Transcript_2570/g.4865  ORF Transcript_2570/g.4865 Transcript_2570/m.4865 type:complete len:391 (-) Transcript_2570:2-1174(-)
MPPKGTTIDDDNFLEKVMLAQEIGLPDGWLAQFTYTGNGTRRKFWDTAGNTYQSVTQLQKYLGDETPQKLLESMAKNETDREARRKLAVELGLPDGWGAQITKTSGGIRRKFWDSAGKAYTSVTQLQRHLGNKTPPELLEAVSCNGHKGHNDDGARCKLAMELGLPDGWKAQFTKVPAGTRRKFWDPAGNRYNSVTDLQRHLGDNTPQELLASLACIGKKGKFDEYHAAKSKLATELGLPEGWLAIVYDRGANGKQRKFWDTEGNSYMSLAKLKDALGELPEQLERIKMRKRETQEDCKATDLSNGGTGRGASDRKGRASQEKRRKKQNEASASDDARLSDIPNEAEEELIYSADPTPSSPASTSSSSSSSESSLPQAETEQEQQQQEAG